MDTEAHVMRLAPFSRSSGNGSEKDLTAVPLADCFRCACLANIAKYSATSSISRLSVGCVNDLATLRASSAHFCQKPRNTAMVPHSVTVNDSNRLGLIVCLVDNEERGKSLS